jgi:gluconolactonase
MRRLAIVLGLGLSLAACGGSSDQDDVPDAAPVDAPDAAPTGIDPLLGAGAVQRILPEVAFEFTEGPQWLASRGVLLFTDIPDDTIHELTPPDTLADPPFRKPSGNANGLAVTPDGEIVTAEHGNRRVAVSDGLGIMPLADRFDGKRLNSPNDVIVRDDGTIYFTDPPYGIGNRPDQLDFMGVFRITPDGELYAEWRGPLTARPNGIALSPDQRLLYVADTDQGVVRVWDVAPSGSLSDERILSDDVAEADGMAVDDEGNLFVAMKDGIRAIAPDGTVWGTVDIPQKPTNCAFGGADRRTLYVTAQTGLYRVQLVGAGLL